MCIRDSSHIVRLTGFWMSIYPVTNRQYTKFLGETGRMAPDSFSDRRFNDSAQPVVTVSSLDAQAFTMWLSTKLHMVVAQLPTEAEWEYAARGADGRRYPWGLDPPDTLRATFGQQFDTGRPALVGHSPEGKSPFGIQDMAGNIWEWCRDAYDDYMSVQPDHLDPCRDCDGGRVVRGGSWGDSAK